VYQIVLVVVDDPAVRASLKFALEIEGYRVFDYETADELLESNSFSQKACLIVDYVVPRVDGIEIAASLRERGYDIPTIIMATEPSPALRKHAIEAGLMLVEKPVFGNGLTEAIRAVLANC
jgi:two-component system, LuxR family, response regulator FixJ